jgi:hypothetical protein
MIIPDYNKMTVNVHLKLEEKDVALSDGDIAIRAFSYMTGLKNVDDIFMTGDFRVRVICGFVQVNDNNTYVTSSILVRDKASRDVIVEFNNVIWNSAQNAALEMNIIDFLYKYKKDLFTIKSGVII